MAALEGTKGADVVARCAAFDDHVEFIAHLPTACGIHSTTPRTSHAWRGLSLGVTRPGRETDPTI